MTSATTVEVENVHSKFKSHITKHILTSISVDYEDLSTLKSNIHLCLVASVNITFSAK